MCSQLTYINPRSVLAPLFKFFMQKKNLKLTDKGTLSINTSRLSGPSNTKGHRQILPDDYWTNKSCELLRMRESILFC